MPELTSTVWTCSRCGTTRHLSGTDQPKDWLRVHYVTPPRGSVSDIGRSIGDLCDPCGGFLVDFMTGKNIEQEMAKALEMAAIEKWATAHEIDGSRPEATP